MWIFLQKGKQIIKYTNQTVYLHSVENNTIQRKIVLSGSFMYPAFSFTELILPLHTDCMYTIQKEACSYNVILAFINPERVFPCLLTAMINYDKTYLIKKNVVIGSIFTKYSQNLEIEIKSSDSESQLTYLKPTYQTRRRNLSATVSTCNTVQGPFKHNLYGFPTK